MSGSKCVRRASAVVQSVRDVGVCVWAKDRTSDIRRWRSACEPCVMCLGQSSYLQHNALDAVVWPKKKNFQPL